MPSSRFPGFLVDKQCLDLRLLICFPFGKCGVSVLLAVNVVKPTRGVCLGPPPQGALESIPIQAKCYPTTKEFPLRPLLECCPPPPSSHLSAPLLWGFVWARGRFVNRFERLPLMLCVVHFTKKATQSMFVVSLQGKPIAVFFSLYP